MNFIEKLEKVEQILSRYDSHVGEMARDLAIKNAIQSSRRAKESLCNIEEENRLLRIGIVGSVNAGKSTLINALLFDGKPVIPKAATPMTAALTELKHGPELRLDVNYYSEADLQEIEENYNTYKEKYDDEYSKWLENLIERFRKRQQFQLSNSEIAVEELELIKKDAADKARRAMKKQIVLAAAYEQYESFRESSVDVDSLRSNQSCYCPKDEQELNYFLMKHVSNGGEFMPFTKSVTITTSNPLLEGLMIIDTPGINDPVQSREQRTRELLNQCDAVLILSPASQFITQEDLILLDRITSKEGVNELFVVGTKTDNALASNLHEKHNGNLYAALDDLQQVLLNHLSRTISTFNDEHKELGDVFLQLVDRRNERVFLTAGYCSTIIRELEKGSCGDASFAWQNLQKYEDYFDPKNKELSILNLKRLLNIDSIRGAIQSTRDKKDELIERKQKEYTDRQISNLDKYLREIGDSLKDQISILKEAKIDELGVKLKHMESALDRVTIELDDEYDKSVRKLTREIERFALGVIHNLSKIANVEIIDSQVESTVSTEVKKKFLGMKICGSKTVQVPINGLMTGQAVDAMEKFTHEAEVRIRHGIEELLDDWRSNVSRKLIDAIVSMMESIYIDQYTAKRSIFNVIMNKVKEPSFSFEIVLPPELRPRGLLKGSDASDFLAGIKSYLHKLEKRYIDSIKAYKNDVHDQLKTIDISKEITNKYIKEMEKLTADLSSKEDMINALEKCHGELVEVS